MLGYNGGRRLLFWHQPLVAAAAAEWRSRELPQLPGSLLHPCPYAPSPQPGHLCQGPPPDWFDKGDIVRRKLGRNSMQRRGGAAGHRIQLLKCTSLPLLVVINTTVNDFMDRCAQQMKFKLFIKQQCLNAWTLNILNTKLSAVCKEMMTAPGSCLIGSNIWGGYSSWFHQR